MGLALTLSHAGFCMCNLEAALPLRRERRSQAPPAAPRSGWISMRNLEPVQVLSSGWQKLSSCCAAVDHGPLLGCRTAVGNSQAEDDEQCQGTAGTRSRLPSSLLFCRCGELQCFPAAPSAASGKACRGGSAQLRLALKQVNKGSQ